ncbi:hypothetical protein B0H16DRAFT_1300148 [Mycena metata]|uniref:Helix-turn-helix domain-containing protein n=1 Tax=Mycena metata TaxID=1033252 RepID=A0AAD7K9A4_9AGAR|nr:hypothetical protein B0H16DRAFT_1300148 [Mycena metata]
MERRIIPWKSCHSADSEHAWVKGELIRYVRICSNEADFAKTRKDYAIRLHDRGYPGRWLQNVFDEVEYKAERPKVLKSPLPNGEGDGQELHLLKLTHNPIWDAIDLRPVWRDLDEASRDLGAGYPEFRFLASFKKPISLGDRFNKTNHNTLKTYHGRPA